MKILIVDDEAPARSRLRRLVSAFAGMEIVGEAEDGEHAVEQITALAPDVVLLDIGMPKLDGFGVVDVMGDDMPITIFCTAYDEHALRAFDAQAVDYLLKPVQSARLEAALERAQTLVRSTMRERKRGRQAISSIVEGHGAFLTRLLVSDGQRAYLLPVDRIDWIRADRNHCWVHSGTSRFRVRRTLSSLAERLDDSTFLRVSRSDVVRIDAIREIQPWSHGDYRIVLRDNTTLNWSRRYRGAASRLSF